MKNLTAVDYVQTTYNYLTAIYGTEVVTEETLLEALDNAIMMNITMGWLMKGGEYEGESIWESYQSLDFIKLCAKEVSQVFSELSGK